MTRRPATVVFGAAAAVAALAGPALWRPAPRLVWNASASSPIGLYSVAPARAARPGEVVIAWPPPPARELGAARRYLPRNVPLVKRVAAAAGDRVCASGSAILVNGRVAAVRRATDSLGRAMPWWSGCEDLHGGDLFLLNAAVPEAFDGRYFGITRRVHVVGRARLLWSR